MDFHLVLGLSLKQANLGHVNTMTKRLRNLEQNGSKFKQRRLNTKLGVGSLTCRVKPIESTITLKGKLRLLSSTSTCMLKSPTIMLLLAVITNSDRIQTELLKKVQVDKNGYDL